MSTPFQRASPTRRAAAWAAACALAAAPCGGPALAAPSGEQVISGQATFTREGNRTTIDTATSQTIVEYQSFDILAGEVVRINQPDAASRILNRVPHGDPTRVDGQLGSNGLVYILNPAGVFLGASAVVDVSGLVAGAGHLSDADFLAGVDRFTGLGGDVEVAAGAEVRAGGLVALVGRRVANFGAIRTEGGMIALVAGENALLAKIDGRVVVRIDPGAAADAGPPDQFALTQAGELDAGSGRVSLTAGDTWSLALNHEGISRARDIELEAGGDGLVRVAGVLDASAAGEGETGGRVQVRGDRVALLGARLDASGSAGGGEIQVGGDRGGEGPGRTARRTYVDEGSELVADALERGDGGEIVVWADEAAGFHGLASARGGAQAGDGGFVEISGRYFLESRGEIALDAPRGESGTLLYDPLEIEIVGSAPGALDGSDPDLDTEPNEERLVGNGGSLGSILSGDFSGPGDAVPFVVYESELEGTDANIVLEAQHRVFASGSFDGDDVVILPGNDLTISTTAPGALNRGIDLTTPDGADPSWVVRDGGTLLLITSAGNVDAPSEEVNAPIRAGTLVFDGRAYQVEEELGLSLALATTRTAVAVSTLEGDIEIAGIRANGDDAVDIPASGDDPAALRLASAGGGVSVTAQSGDVRVGRIEANGGSDAGLVSPGGLGGTVVVTSADGDLEVTGGIEARGGDGRAGYRAGQAIFAAGGGGGEIVLTADRIDDASGKGRVDVLGDLLADGGDGVGVFSDAEFGAFAAVGGTGGRVEVDGVEAIHIGSEDDAVRIDASAGDGSGAGGSPTQLVQGEFANVVDAISISTPLLAEGVTGGDVVLLRTELVARGGNAGLAGGPGGSGGTGGNVLVQSNSGGVFGLGGTIDTSGGDGGFGEDGPAAQAGFGGAAGLANVDAALDARIGGVTAQGGQGVNGAGGAGGQVLVSSTDGDVLVGDIAASGGGASESIERLDGIAGGPGSSQIRLTTGDDAVDSDAGSVLLLGSVTSFGGQGQDADGAPEFASGGFLTIDADEAAAGAPGSLVQVGTANVTAPRIDAIAVGGTPGDGDRATLTAEGQLDAVLFGEGEALESLEIVQRSVAAGSAVVRSAGAAEVLRVVGDDVARTQTVELMATQAGDPSLEFAFDEAIEAPEGGGAPPAPGTLRIGVGAVSLGTAGGGLRNGGAGVGSDNDGAIEGDGAGVHVASAGDFSLDGGSIGAETPVQLMGTPDAALRLVASGEIDVAVDAAFGALDVTQGAALGATRIGGAAGDDVTITGNGDDQAPVSRVDAVTDAGFAYRLVAPAADDGELPDVELARLRLGGSGRIEAPGDIHISAPLPGLTETVALPGAGSDLGLQAGGDVIASDPGAGNVSIDMGAAALPDDPRDLVVELGGSLGGPGAELQTRNLDRVAGLFRGGFQLRNRSGGDLRIGTAPEVDPSDLDGEAVAEELVGLVSTDATVVGDVVVANEAGAIVLGEIDAAAGQAVHVASTGDLRLEAPLEIDNARFVSIPVSDGLGGTTLVLRPRNEAGLVARGDIELGSVDTAAGALAVDDRADVEPDDRLDPAPAAGRLTLSAPTGTVVLRGDVGNRDDEGVLDRLDTTAMRLEGAAHTLRAGELVFRGGLDGASQVALVGQLPPGTDTLASRVSFGGDVGTATALAGLDVEADEIRFSLAPEDGATSANRVVVAGDLRLDTRQASTPPTATVIDTLGGLSFEAGRFEVGPTEKISVTGTLAIRADTVRVADLSAGRLRVDSPSIELWQRDAAPIELADGSAVMDEGVDWVANEIALSSVPTLVGGAPGAPPPTLVLGSGGLSVPGSLAEFRVRRFTSGLDAVTAASFAGQDGAVLDLRGTGGAFGGDPARQLPRVQRIALVDPPTPTSGAPAAPAPRVPLAQALAFLHCGELGVAAPGCSAEDASALDAFAALDDSALGTPRAREIHERYRALLTAPGSAEQLRALFARAGRAFAATREWDDGSIDGAELYRFLKASREPGRPALEALRELAWLLAQIELLGLDEADARRLQAAVARDFARAADLPGLTPSEVRAAAAASSVQLPRPAALP